MRHCLAVDFESWTGHPLLSYSTTAERRALDAEDTRRQGYALLDLFRRHKVFTTWFVVGEVADWYPDMVEAVAREGHEVGYHTHFHPHTLTPEGLRQEIAHSRAFLERYQPRGFQAPRIHLPRGCYAVLRDAGFRYSSSRYGETCRLSVDGLDELPVSTARWWGRAHDYLEFPRPLTWRLLCQGEVPYGSTLFLGLWGATGTRYWIRRQERRGLPSNLFIHNWQLFDPSPGERDLRRRMARWDPAVRLYHRPVMPAFTNLLDSCTFGPLADALPTADADLSRSRR